MTSPGLALARDLHASTSQSRFDQDLYEEVIGAS